MVGVEGENRDSLALVNIYTAELSDPSDILLGGCDIYRRQDLFTR